MSVRYGQTSSKGGVGAGAANDNEWGCWMEREDLWTAVLERDAACDGAFVYAVDSTGIYCRPSCPSRKPRREQVRFYFLPAEAEAAGFRPCLRCHPAGEAPDDPNVALMGEVCRYLEQCDERIPTLDELSARFGLSPYHLQRTFKRIVGVSPRQYAGVYRQARFKTALKDRRRRDRGCLSRRIWLR